MTDNHNIKQEFIKKAHDIGFDAVGFTSPSLKWRDKKRFQSFIENKEYGDMQWMARHIERRLDPKNIMENVETIIVLAMNYAPNFNPLHMLENKRRGYISAYAQNFDYHDIMKKKLKILAREFANNNECDVKVFVDTAPILEKPLAMQAGIGWQGKHSNLVSKEFGSWLFLSEIFTSFKFTPDLEASDRCGSCHKCLDICPTNAFIQPYQLDTEKCIAYLTIEYAGVIPPDYCDKIGNRIYGCDDCLAVCPWNKFASQSSEMAYHARPSIKNTSLHDFLIMGEDDFKNIFRKNPVRRIGHERFIRNVLIAAGNSNDLSLAPLIHDYISHSSVVLSETAKWAYGKITHH